MAMIVAAYLVGSVSFSYVIVRILKGIDIRTIGSGNAGATNVLRAAGKTAAAVALILDVGKGLAVVLLARAMGASPPILSGVAIAVVLGHIFPIFLGFRGGKGVATAAGTLAALAPVLTLVDVGLFVVVVAWKRYVSLGSIVAAAAFPVLVLAGRGIGWVSDEEFPWLLLSTSVIAGIIIVKHAQNLSRLRHGTESRLGQTAGAPAAPKDTN